MKVGSYVVVFISVRIWSIVNRGALLYHWRGRDGGNELTRTGRHDQSHLRATANKCQSVLPLSRCALSCLGTATQYHQPGMGCRLTSDIVLLRVLRVLWGGV
jgi:hypothetical protein